MNLMANFTSTRLFGDVKTIDSLPDDSKNTNGLFSVEEKTRMEKGQPDEKIILAIVYRLGKTGFVLRNTRFGKTSTATPLTNPDRTLYEFFFPKLSTDVSLDYSPKTWLTVTAGANNVFNVYSDRLKNYEKYQPGDFHI